MQSVKSLVKSYETFRASEATNRFFKHADLVNFLKLVRSNPNFKIQEAGLSAEGRSIHLIHYGDGPIKVFLWSQMHGNEATATLALLDLFNFLSSNEHDQILQVIKSRCSLFIMPLVNPDGAEVFTRRNAQGIDINRDFHHQQSPEGRLLRTVREELKPHFGFNLHDQTTKWSASDTGNPATISLLAPAFDAALTIDEVRGNAIKVITEINEMLQSIIPGHVGRFDDEYEPRAFGDNFQAAGTSTILIEAGGYVEDPEKQHIRKLVFLSIVRGLLSISESTFTQQTEAEYFNIPENKLYHFQILLRNVQLELNGHHYRSDIGIHIEEKLNEDLVSVTTKHLIGDMGDLSNRFGYKQLDCSTYNLIQTRKLIIDEPADLILMDGLEVLLEIENGLVSLDKL